MASNLIIFDGKCGFCNKTIMFIAKRDLDNKFIFVSNLSVYGIEYLNAKKLTYLTKTTIILVENEKYFIEGLAIRKIFKNLQINFVFKILINYTSLTFLNFIYKFISKNRLLFTKNNCEIPSKNIISKFILQ